MGSVRVIKKLAICDSLRKKNLSYFLSTSCVLSIIFHRTVLPNFSHIVAYRKNYEICHNTLGQTHETAVVQKGLPRSTSCSRPCPAILQAELINIPEGPLFSGHEWDPQPDYKSLQCGLSLKILQSSLYGIPELMINIPG